MTPDAATKLLEMLKAHPVPYQGGTWVKAPCPLARWTHQHGHDSNPSFGISVEPGKRSHYHCFACSGGSLQELVDRLVMYTQQYCPDQLQHYPLKQIYQIVEDEELTVLPLPEYSELAPSPFAEFQEWPAYFVEAFTPWNYSKECVDYMKTRGITKEQAMAHNLRWDAQKKMVVFPYSNVYGKLAGARGRSADPNVPKHKKHYDYTWNDVNNASLVWYNEEVFNNEQPIVVVEGQFDCLAVERCYPNVIANLTATPSPFKMKRLQGAEGLIFMTDNDKAGDTAREKYVAYAQQHKIPHVVVELPKDYDSEGNFIKQDPGSLGTDWIRTELQKIGLIS
jgi:5S rRNA maturation endonuclease (ribonuclease M5)